MVQLNATMEQTRETQLTQLYDVLGFRRVIARYDVLNTLHETGARGTKVSLNLHELAWDIERLSRLVYRDVTLLFTTPRGTRRVGWCMDARSQCPSTCCMDALTKSM